MPYSAGFIKRTKNIRPSARKRGYNYQHEQLRKMVLNMKPICEVPGCMERSTDLDHIIPISKGGARWALTNLQALCHMHHSSKTWREMRG